MAAPGIRSLRCRAENSQLSENYEISSNSSTDTAQDRLNFTNLTRSQVTFSRSGDDLLLSRNGSSTDGVRVSNWFTVPGNQLDFVQFTDQTLTQAQVNALFGGSLMSAQSGATVSREPDSLERALRQFVDAMNHFGTLRHLVFDRALQPAHQMEAEWMGVVEESAMQRGARLRDAARSCVL